MVCVHTLFPAIIPENIMAIISVAWAVGAIVYDTRLMMNIMDVDMAVARRNLQSHYGGWEFRRPVDWRMALLGEPTSRVEKTTSKTPLKQYIVSAGFCCSS